MVMILPTAIRSESAHMPSSSPITCYLTLLTAHSRWRSQSLPDPLSGYVSYRKAGLPQPNSHKQLQTSAVFSSRHGMTSAAKPLRHVDAATQPCFSCLANRRRYVPDSSTADPHASWSLICANSFEVIFTCYCYLRYCNKSLLLNDFLLMCIFWSGSRNDPVLSAPGV